MWSRGLHEGVLTIFILKKEKLVKNKISERQRNNTG